MFMQLFTNLVGILAACSNPPLSIYQYLNELWLCTMVVSRRLSIQYSYPSVHILSAKNERILSISQWHLLSFIRKVPMSFNNASSCYYIKSRSIKQWIQEILEEVKCLICYLHQEIKNKKNGKSMFKGTRGVQHGVWTRLQSFFIIRESIDITMLELRWNLEDLGSIHFYHMYQGLFHLISWGGGIENYCRRTPLSTTLF